MGSSIAIIGLAIWPDLTTMQLLNYAIKPVLQYAATGDVVKFFLQKFDLNKLGRLVTCSSHTQMNEDINTLHHFHLLCTRDVVNTLL